MTAAVRIPAVQRTPEWHAARRHGIGSSDAPIVAGVSPWGDIQRLWAVKAGLIDPRDASNAGTTWGSKLEDVIAEAYTERTGRRVRRVNQLRAHRDHPWMLASLDRMVIGEPVVVEIKTARFPNEEWGQDASSEIPPAYLIQTQHQMAVVGATRADVPVLFSGSDLRIYHVPRDQGLIDDLLELEAEFWRCVEQRTPPPAVPRASRATGLRQDEELADAELESLLVDGHAARQAKAEAEARSKELDDQVKAALEARVAVRGGSIAATYRPGKDVERVSWELVAAAQRKVLEEVASLSPVGRAAWQPPDLDALQSMFTSVRPGNRPLIYRPLREDQP